MTDRPAPRNVARVKSSDKSTAILLDSASDLLFEIYLMRGDCSRAAEFLLRQKQVDPDAVELCARLDESLARSFRLLRATLERMQRSHPGSPKASE